MKWSEVKKITTQIITKDGEEIEVIKTGANVEITVPRSTDQHKFIFSVINRTLNLCEPFKAIRPNNTDDFLLVFKEYAGMYDLVELPWGVAKKYHSISFNKMDGVEFQKVGSNIIDFCFILLGYGPIEHMDTLNDYIKQVEYEYNCRVNR